MMAEVRQWMGQHRWLVGALSTIVVLLLVLVVVLVPLQRMFAGEVLPGVAVDGVDVGGADQDELVEVVTTLAEHRLAQRLEINTDDAEVNVTHADLGEAYEVATAVDQAWRVGRRGALARITAHVQAWRGTLDVPLELPRRLDTDRLEDRLDRIADDLDRETRTADIAFVVDGEDVEVEVTEPQPGRTVDRDALRDDVVRHLDERADRADPDADPDAETARLEAPLEDEVAPSITMADLEHLRPLAELAISAPVTLRHPANAQDVVLSPVELAEVLRFERDEDADEGQRLSIVGDPDVLEELVADLDLTVDPVEATIAIVDGQPEIEGGTRGFRPDLAAALDRILDLATEQADDDVVADDVPDDVDHPQRIGELPGDSISPDLSRDEVKDLGIEEVVSSFATPLTPGQPRNENLQRAAELLDGALLLPGERLSLNERLGPRTADRGFIENGYIDDEGELISVVGGGVSQMATTLMNAAWFAGIEIVTFQPHSLYFSRYPEGREATLAWDAIDLVIENDSPYGILISSGATEREVEVTFWSTPWAEVATETSERFDVVEGAERDGFAVSFSRTITYPDGSSRTEEFTHRYDPED